MSYEEEITTDLSRVSGDVNRTGTTFPQHGFENEYDKKFDDDMRELFTAPLKENKNFGNELWSAMANIGWYHETDPAQTECRRSYRGAGALIADMLRLSNYSFST